MLFSYHWDVPSPDLSTDITCFKNNKGSVSAAHDFTLQGPTLALSNEDGQLFAGHALDLAVAQLSNSGGLLGGKTVKLRLPHFKPQGTLHALESIKLSVKNYTHIAPQVFDAPHIFLETDTFENHFPLRSSHSFQIKTGSFLNKDLINSDQITLDINKGQGLENLGRISCAHLHLNANTIPIKANILKRLTVSKNTGIIDASETLCIGVEKLDNCPGGLLSSKKIHIGGHVSPTGEVTGRANIVNNFSVIDAVELIIESRIFNNLKTYLAKDKLVVQALPKTFSRQLAPFAKPEPLQLGTLPQFNGLPLGSGFQFQRDIQHPYLFEIDPQSLKLPPTLTLPRISSDYLLRDKLQLQTLPQRLGNGLYEQQKVRAQIQALKPPGYLLRHESDEALFTALMDAAHLEAHALNLTIGEPPTLQQVSQLKQDILWMVMQEVTLRNGQKRKVLVPQVYLALNSANSHVLKVGVSAKRIEIKAKNLNTNAAFFSEQAAHIVADNMTLQEEITSKDALKLTVANLDSTHSKIKGARVTLTSKDTLHIKAQVHASKELNLAANTIQVTGGTFTTQGTFKVEAEDSIQFTPDKHVTRSKEVTQQTHAERFASTTCKTERTSCATLALGSTFVGKNVHIATQGDLTGEGLQLAGENSVHIQAKGKIELKGAASTLTSQYNTSTDKSGFSLGSVLSLGAIASTTEESQKQTRHTLSRIHTEGSLTMDAGHDLSLVGCDLEASDKLKLKGKQVSIQEATDTLDTHVTHHQTQAGISLNIGGRIAALVGRTTEDIHSIQDADSKKLAFAKAAQTAYTVGNLFNKNKNREQGTSYSDLATSITSCKPMDIMKAIDLEAKASFGIKKRSQTTNQKVCQAQLSRIQGDTVEITADEGLSVSGSQLEGKDIHFQAASVNIKQAENTANENQSSTHYQAELGVSVGLRGAQGFFKAQSSTQESSRSNIEGQKSVVKASQTLKIESQGDTRLEGVQASGEEVIAQVGGNLELISTQDTAEEVRQTSTAHLHIGMPVGPMGKTSLHGGGNIESMTNKTSTVEERTTLEAGQGGFTLEVGQETHLIGAGIESASDQNQLTSGTITIESARNSAHYETSQKGIQFSEGPRISETLTNNATSNTSLLTSQPQTKSGITEGSLSKAKLILNSAEQTTSISSYSSPVHQPIAAFDTKQMEEQAALGKIVSELGMEMSGDVIECIEEKMQAWDPEKDKELRSKIETLRIALHAGTAGLSAGLSGSSVSGAVAGVMAGDLAALALGDNEDIAGLGKAMSALARNTIAGAAGAVAGAAFDGKAGAYSGATQALTADAWNRQLHRKETITLAELMEGKSPKEEKELKEAAAYLARASKGVPDSDPKKAGLKAMEERGSKHTEKLVQLKQTDLFKYTQYETFSDWLLQHDEGVQRIHAGIQIANGLVGGKLGIDLMMGAAMSGHPSFVTQAAGITTLSAYTFVDGIEKAIQTYHSKEAQRFLDSLGLDTYPEERDPIKELLRNTLIVATPAIAGKAGHKGMQAWQRVPFFSPEKRSLVKSAVQSYKGQEMTNIARAVNKHPEYFGYSSHEALCKAHPKLPDRNAFAEEQIKKILENGKRTFGTSANNSEGWITYTLPNGTAASWSTSGRFIGCRGQSNSATFDIALKNKETAVKEIISEVLTQPRGVRK